MIYKRRWIAACLLLAFLLLAGCGAADNKNTLLVGSWRLDNIEAMVGDQAADISDFEEYKELGLVWDFASNAKFTFEIAYFLDLGTMIRDIMDDTAEVEAGPVNLIISLEGTYELIDDGRLILIYDYDSVTTSPEEYCYIVGDFDQCISIGNLSAGFEEFLLFHTDGAFYEVDGNTLALWDDTCEYPADKSCAARFSK